MEYISSCLLCGGINFDKVARKDANTVVRCQKCGLTFVNPRAIEKEIIEQYKSDSTSPSQYYINTANTDRVVFQKWLALIERYFAVGKLLDVGSSVGTFLETAQERGWNVEGIEVNINSVQYCQRKGLRGREGLFDYKFFSTEKNIFDVIHMGDVIEHLRNPMEAIGLANSLLKVGGGLVIITPNFDSFVARTLQIKPLEHLFYFTGSTIQQMLGKNGFKPLLILRTTRRRDINSMKFGTTFKSPLMKMTLSLLVAFRLSGILSWILEKVVKDELLVIAQKIF